MADEADLANDRRDQEGAALIAAVRATAATIPAGEPGDCYECGDPMPRLVNGRCAPCRDGRRRRRN